MRTLDAGLAAHLASGATTLATCWRIERADGLVLGFTDHDQTLSFGGLDYVPAHGLDTGEASQKFGAQVATGEVVGVLNAAAIAEDDILLGRYDGARVETWRVNWRNVAQRHRMRVATIGEIVREDGLFRAELRSLQQALNVPRGRVYQALCDAEFGDARCGVDASGAAYRAEASVAAVRDRYRLEVAGLETFTAGWFGFGRALWTDGRRTGLNDRIVSHARTGGADILGFAVPVGDWVEPGDALRATAGCDRRFATCRDRFANAANFRGFPHIPGSDFVFGVAGEGDRLGGAPVVP